MANDTKFNLTIKINGKEVANTLQGVGKEVRKLKGELNKLTPGTDDFVKKSAELKKARDRYSEIKNEIHGTNRVLEEAEGNWNNFTSGLLSGNLKQAGIGLKGIASNIRGITKAALAFIATPLGAALAVLTTVGLGVKKWVEYHIEIDKTNRLIRDLTQETGTAVDLIRVRAEVLQKTFEVGINKSVETAKSLSRSFGISYSEAFDLIEDGAIRGKLKNDEFLDSLKEYPVQFKNAGFSAQDFANIVSTGIDLSIYTDKLPDAIKEFNLSITEQTKASKQALTNAFGKEFTGKLLRGVKDGSISAKQALAQISDEAERIGLNSQQAQQLTADLFRGAGEDAGGALKIFQAVNIALNEQKKPLTEIQKIQKQQLDANKELSSVYTQLFASGSKGFNLWIEKGKLFATKTLIKILKGGVDLYNWFVDLNNENRTFSAILTTIGKVGSTGIKVLINAWNNLGNLVGGVGDIIKGVFTFKTGSITKGLARMSSATTKFFSDVKDQAIKDFQDIEEAWNGNNKLKQLSLDDFIADDTTPTEDTSNTDDPNTNNGNGEMTPEDQRIVDSKKKLAEFLDQWDEQQKIKKQIEDLEKDEAAQLKEELELEAKYAKLEAQAYGEKDLLKRLAEQKNKELDAIEKKWNDKFTDDNKKYKEKQFKDNEVARKKELAARRKVKNDIINGAIALAGQETRVGQALLAAKGVLAAKETLIQLGILKTKAATAVAEGTMATTVGAANTAKVGFPKNIPLLIAFAAQAVGIISAIKSATQTAKSVKGFYKGGYTGDKAIRYDDQDGIAFDTPNGPYHIKEWVAPRFMTESPRYAPTIQWLERERKAALGKGFFDGGNTFVETPLDSETSQEILEINNPNQELIQTLRALQSEIQKGIKAYQVRDYEDFILRKELDEEHEQIFNNTRS